MLRREPGTRYENLLQLALDEIERLKRTKTQTTDGSGGIVVTTPGSQPGGGSTVPAPVEGAPHVLFGSKNTGSLHVTAGAGLDIAYEASQVWVGGAFYSIAAGTLTMTNAATNYVFVNSAGAVAKNTTGFPTSSLPLAVVVTAGGAITSVTDRRAYLNDQGLTQAHALFGTQHSSSLRVTDGGTTPVAVSGGKSDIGGSTRTTGGNESFALQKALPAGDYTNIKAYIKLDLFTRGARAAIYADAAGVPGALVASTPEVIVNSADGAHWQTFNFSAPVAITAATYWLAIIFNSGGFTWTLYHDAGAANTGERNNADTYSDGFEDPWAGGTLTTENYSIYANGTVTEPAANYEAGQVWASGTFYSIAASVIALAQDATNYIYVNGTSGVVATNTTAFPSDCIPLAIAVTTGLAITSLTDERAYLQQLGGAYSNEQAQDAVGTILTDTASIDFTYDDAGNTISAVVLAGGVDHGGLGGLADDDHTQYLLADGTRIAAKLQIDDATFFLDIVSANPRITFDTGDFIEYNRASDTFVLDVGSVSKFSYIGGATDEFRYNAVARYETPAVLSGTVVLDTRDAGAGAIARLDIISEDAIAGVDWYRKSATDTRIKFAFELEGIVEQDPDLIMYRFTGAGGAESKFEMVRFVNATGLLKPQLLEVVSTATMDATLNVGDALTVGPSDFGMLAHLILRPGSGDNRVGITSGTGRLGIFVGDPAGANFEAISVLHANGYVGILNASPQQPLDVTGAIRASGGFEAMNDSLLKLYDTGSSNYIGLRADAARTTDLVYVLPAADPSASDVLTASAPAAGVVTLSWSAGGGGGYTDEQAQDAVGTILLDTATIDLSYDDGTPTISADVIQSGLDHGSIGGLADDDHTQYVLRSILSVDGDIFIRSGGVIDRLAIGGANKVLTVTSGLPSWEDATGGGGAPAIPVWHRNFMMMGA